MWLRPPRIDFPREAMIEVIQLYPYLKNGEIWRDIEEEYEDTNLKPTSDDSHWM
jgi:hypothetical protein